jgi:hypothetical protein
MSERDQADRAERRVHAVLDAHRRDRGGRVDAHPASSFTQISDHACASAWRTMSSLLSGFTSPPW